MKLVELVSNVVVVVLTNMLVVQCEVVLIFLSESFVVKFVTMICGGSRGGIFISQIRRTNSHLLDRGWGFAVVKLPVILEVVKLFVVKLLLL